MMMLWKYIYKVKQNIDLIAIPFRLKLILKHEITVGHTADSETNCYFYRYEIIVLWNRRGLKHGFINIYALSMQQY